VVSQQKAAVVEAHATAVEQPSTIEAQSAVVEQPALSHARPAAIEQTLVQQVGTASPQTEPTIVSTAAVEHRAVQASPPARADFGWLSESLWARIEQLKRYPTQARSRRWEGKVVIQAVIREDGTILHCQIAESSGHGILDQDAISVLRRASPLSLKHPLGQAQITILVPIAYQLHS
jgi:protein TonB